METQNLTGAFWCDPQKHSDWNVIPCSAFDHFHTCPDRMLEFQTVLNYSGTDDFHLRFTGGCRFRMLINGRFAEDGPVEAGGDYGKEDAPNWWFYDEKDISPFLNKGENTLVFQMIPAGMCQMDYSLGFGWLWCAIQKQGKWCPIPAKKWKFRLNPFYQSRNFQDFMAEDTCKWESGCKSVNVPLKAQKLDLSPLTDVCRTDYRFRFPFGHDKNIRIKGKKIYVTPGNAVTFFLEFPEERCGHFEVNWNCEYGIVLRMEFQELYGNSGMTEMIRTSAGTGTYRTIKIYPFHYVRITLEASDFMTPDTGGKGLFSFCMYERHFPIGTPKALREKAKIFRKIDDICLRNIVMCMQRMHLDSPVHQEGLGCTGDYRIEALAEYAAFGESRLAKADLIRTALLLRQQGKLFHTSYELCYVLMFREYVEYTHDLKLLNEYYDTLDLVYRRFHSFTGATGLLSEAENYLFIDWVVTGKYTCHHPPASRGMGAMTALWYGALQASAEMSGLLRKTADRKKYEAEAKKVRMAFNRNLWDAKRGCYLDGIPGLSKRAPSFWLPKEDGETSATSLTSIMALAYGLPYEKQKPEELLAKVIRGELPLRPTVYYTFYLFEAVMRYNAWDIYGKKLVLQWKTFLHSGLRESWICGDYSHGWGASPSIFLR